MSRNGPIREEAPPGAADGGRADPGSDALEGEISFDDLRFAKPRRPDETPFVHQLQERVEAALREPEPTGDAEVETIERWPLRVQALCIVGGSALCWAVILVPFLIL